MSRSVLRMLLLVVLLGMSGTLVACGEGEEEEETEEGQ